MWLCVLVTSELGLGIGTGLLEHVASHMVPGSVRGCSGDTADSDREDAHIQHVYTCTLPPTHKDKERNTLLENLNVKTKKPWAGGMAQGLDAAEPSSQCDSGTHRLGELTPTSCHLFPTWGTYPIKYIDKYNLTMSNNNKHVECLFLNFFI